MHINDASHETPRRPPRLVPDRSFPRYSYVPGRFPHPIRDPQGHSYQRAMPLVTCDASRWNECEEYLFGIDLFNHGYYWEAHESWEGAWHAVGRLGTVADFLKGLIKLAAAGVKLREGQPEGTARHLARAKVLFRQVQAEYPMLMGMNLTSLVARTDQLQATASPASTIHDANFVESTASLGPFWSLVVDRPEDRS